MGKFSLIHWIKFITVRSTQERSRIIPTKRKSILLDFFFYNGVICWYRNSNHEVYVV